MTKSSTPLLSGGSTEIAIRMGKTNGYPTSEFSHGTEIKVREWKRPREISYDVMQLIHSDLEVQPCRFGRGGRRSKFKNSALLRKMYEKSYKDNRRIKLAVCITMYNEEV